MLLAGSFVVPGCRLTRSGIEYCLRAAGVATGNGGGELAPSTGRREPSGCGVGRYSGHCFGACGFGTQLWPSQTNFPSGLTKGCTGSPSGRSAMDPSPA